jgi:hypothetical protein
MEMYIDGQEADLAGNSKCNHFFKSEFLAGITLILASIIAGYLVESAFKHVLSCMSDWTYLIAFLVVGYYLSGFLLYQLNSNAINLNDGNLNQQTPEAIKTLKQDLIKLWNQRDSMPSHTNAEITMFNSKFNAAFNKMPFCDGKIKQMPTRYPFNFTSYDPRTVSTCYTKVSN